MYAHLSRTDLESVGRVNDRWTSVVKRSGTCKDTLGDVSIQVHHTATKRHAEPECTNGWTRGVKRKVFDVFPINTEIDVLMVRLHELNSTVDRFVILEAPYTFSGLSKPLHFKNAEPPPTPVRVTEALQAAVLVH